MDLIREAFIDRLQKEVINPKLVSAPRSVENVVINTMLKLRSRSISPIGYRIYEPTVEEVHAVDTQEYDSKTRKKGVPMSVTLDKSALYAIDFWYCFDTTFAENINVLRNTVAEYNNVSSKLSVNVHSTHLSEIVTDYQSAILSFDCDTDSLLYKITMFIPISINNAYFLLGGNRYYAKWQLYEKYRLFRNGKLLVDHNSTTFSHLQITDGIVLHSMFGQNINALTKVSNNVIINFGSIFGDHIYMDGNICKAKHEKASILAKTYNDFVTRKLDISNDVVDVSEDIIGGLKILCGETIPIKFALHYGLEDYLKNRVDDYVKRVGIGRTRRLLKTVKNRGKLRAHIVATTIKKTDGYHLPSGVNSRDKYELFKYTLKRKDNFSISKSDRQVSKKFLGKVDPNATSSSKNVGVTGSLVYTIKDKHLDLRNK